MDCNNLYRENGEEADLRTRAEGRPPPHLDQDSTRRKGLEDPAGVDGE